MTAATLRTRRTPNPDIAPYIAIPIILGLYALLVAMRMPQTIMMGRFWAEEGTVFFSNAWTKPPLEALLYSYGGYLNIVANAASLAARWCLPLAYAPYLTIAVGLLFQLCPPLLLLLARDPWLQDWRVRAAGLMLLLFVPAADEIWLQTLHCQFELALCCAIALALEIPTGRRTLLPLALLAIAPLCGPGAIALVPLFLLRALIERTRGRTAQLAALLAGSAIQLAFFFHTASGRSYTTDPAILLPLIAIKHLAVPFLGMQQARDIATEWSQAVAAGHPPLLAMALPCIGLAALAAAAATTRNTTALWLLVAAGTSAVSGYFGSLDGAASIVHEFNGERYAFVPQSLVALCLLSLAAKTTPIVGYTFMRPIAAAACAWLLVVGVQQYRRPWPSVAYGPPWRPQVTAWRADPSHVLQIWPKGWTMTLKSSHD